MASSSRSGKSAIRRAFGIVRRTWRILGTTLLLLIAAELAMRLAFLAKDRLFPLADPDPRLLAEGYDNAPWTPAIFAALKQIPTEWHAFELYHPRPDPDSPIGLDPEGNRSTLDARGGPGPIDGEPSIWVFGGSAAWGWGARSDLTVPSQLATYLVATKPSVRIHNFAQPGYVSTQDSLALLMKLRERKAPDLVIFYSGVNDVLASLQNGRPGLPQNEANRRREFNLLNRPGDLARAFVGAVAAESAFNRLATAAARRLRPARPIATQPFGTEQAEQLLTAYEHNMQLAADLGRRHGFPVLACWQPSLFTKTAMRPYEAEKANQYAWLRAPIAEVNRLIDAGRLKDLPVKFADFRHVLDDEEKLVFVDFCHTTEHANVSIAERLAQEVQALLAPPSSPGEPAP